MGRQPQTKAARALAIGRKIAELEAELKPIQRALAELKREHDLLFEEEPKQLAPASLPKVKRRKGDDPLKGRLLELFGTVDEKGMDMNAISDALDGPNRQSLRAALVELNKERKLERIGKGVYRPRVMALVVTR